MSSINEISERPLVTFALFAYNQEKYIREAVEGAFAQTYTPLEIILSDDCSTDQTFEIMQEMVSAYNGPHHVRVRQCSKNRGFVAHINECIKDATGDIIAWAAGDDISLPERVSLLVRPMIDDANVVGTYSDVQEISLDGVLGKRRTLSRQPKDPTCMDAIRGEYSVGTQSHVFRKRVFSTFGPLRNDLTNEAPAMAFRELLVGKTIYIPCVTVFYRVGSGVSTYSGTDIHKTKISEPVKITNWRLSSRVQMLDDIDRYGNDDYCKSIRNELVRHIEFYRSLLEINENKFSLSALAKNVLRRPTDFRSIRAFIRRNSPDIFWSARVVFTRRKAGK